MLFNEAYVCTCTVEELETIIFPKSEILSGRIKILAQPSEKGKICGKKG